MTRYRRPHTEDASPGWLFRLFVGDARAQARRWGVVVAALFVVFGVVGAAVASPSISLPVEGITLFVLFWPMTVLYAESVFGTVMFLGWVGLAMWPAYRNAGLLVSWGLLVAPMWGMILARFVLYGLDGNEPGIGQSLGPPYFFFLALLVTIVLGTLGFILGTGLRRIRSWWQTDSRDSES